MSEKPLDQTNLPEHKEPEIVVNEYGETRDPAVVIDSAERTVLLTDEETIVIDKEPRIDVVPTNRPRKVYGGMWGQPELITAGLAMMALFAVVLIYIFLVIPAKNERERNLAERDRLQTELASAQSKYGSIENTQTHVASLMSSVDDFENRHLPVATSGRTSLYQRINSLILSHGLVNTSGPDYAPLEMVDQSQGVENEEERGRAKYKSIYPGVYVTMTVEGSYHNIRRFIREVETGSDFVIVSAVELEPSDAQAPTEQQGITPLQQPVQTPTTSRPNTGAYPPGFNRPNPGAYPPGFSPYNNPMSTAPGQAPTSRSRGKTHGELVSLRLEMAAYFRRTNSVPVTEAPVE